MSSSTILDAADEFSQESLPVRFKPFDVAIRLFIESFVTKPFLFLFKRKTLKVVPTKDEDDQMLETKLRQRFPPRLIDAIIADHPTGGVTNNDAYMLWLRNNLPEDMRIEDFDVLVFLCEAIKLRWNIRRTHEKHMLQTIHLLAYGTARVIQGYILFRAFTAIVSGYATLGLIQILLLLLVMLICALCFDQKH